MKTKNVGMEAVECRDGLWRWERVNNGIDLSSRGHKSKSAAQRAANEAMRNSVALEEHERKTHPAYR